MKLLIILLAMLGAAIGGYNSWHTRGLLVKAAMLSEGFTLSTHVKLRVADHFVREGIMPSDNESVGLPPAKSLFGVSVKRITVNRGGVLQVDFDDRLGKQAMTYTPSVSQVSGLLNWTCTSDSIDPSVLEKLQPACAYQPATDASKLMNAIANKEAVQVRSLLARGVSPNTIVHGNTPLMLAAKIGNSDIVGQLIEGGADIDNSAISSERRTPLMVAITSNHPDIVSRLLSEGASVTQTDYRGLSAVDHAVITDKRLGGQQFVLMVSARFNPQFSGIGSIALQAAVDEEAEHTRLERLYVEYMGAIESCHVQRLTSLLANEGELGSPEMIDGKRLVEHIRPPECALVLRAHMEAKPSFQNATQGYFAARIQECDTREVTKTLEEHEDIDVTLPHAGKFPIDIAVSSGCSAVLRVLVRHQQLEGKLDGDIILNAITQAPQASLLKLVGNLIAADADVNYIDEERGSPLAVAIAMEQPVVAKYLVDAGADVNHQTRNGSYPVIEATKKGYEHLALQMVVKGADLNAQDLLGRTALFAAVQRGQQRLVRSLIRAGANTRITDGNGINPVLLAESQNLRSIKSMLIASSD